VREKRYLNYYTIAQKKKDIRNDKQKLRELESKEKHRNEAKSKINIESFLKTNPLEGIPASAKVTLIGAIIAQGGF
jgi:flagellar motility protein MotE (MotC chaperone)